jgi:NOL1/NOP2/sun family putative RNA methylase
VQLPLTLLQSLQGIKGFDEHTFKALHESGEQIVSIRCNPNKPFSNNNYQLTQVPWCTNGYYLPQRPSFTLDPLFHAGAYYVQEASSMFLEQALRQTVNLSKPIKVLDLCAAPGGKSTLIQALLNEKSFLISNEVIKTRATILTENITKWGAANVVVTNNDPKDFKRLPNYFDAIVIDAPCSGSGLFRKDEKAIEEWSEANVELCSQRQQRILADVYDSLKKDGVIIYSTCSYSKQENEEVLDWIGEQFDVCSLQLNLENEWGIVETQSDKHSYYGYRFYPDKVKGEGFFIAVFKKQNECDGKIIASSKNKIEKPTTKEIEVVKKYVTTATDSSYIKLNNEIIVLPNSIYEDLNGLQLLYIKKAGIKLGIVIKEELIPHHEFALSNLISPSVYKVDVNNEMALNYLRKQEIATESQYKGWALVCYNNLPLGWVKLLANRINNYYPAGWRILNK